MAKMNEQITKGFNMLKWGILMTALHINLVMKFGRVAVGIQIIPAFIGYIIIMLGIKQLSKDKGQAYFGKLKKTSVNLLILSVVQFIIGIVFGYSDVNSVYDIVSPAFILALFLYELILYSDILNMVVKLYKENHKINLADKTRKDRIFFLKAGLGISAVYMLMMIPKLSVFLNYACVSLTLVMKLWLTMILQNVTRQGVEFKQQETKVVE